MEKVIKHILKNTMLIAFGGFIYIILELVSRGRTHWTMVFLGGLCFFLLDKINEVFSWKTPLWIQGMIGGLLVVTPLEYLCGILFNRTYFIWDYREMPFNLHGQICLPYSLLWCLISILGIMAADYLRYYIFNEEKPRYKLF